MVSQTLKPILFWGFTPPCEGGSERHIAELSSRITSHLYTQKTSTSAHVTPIPALFISTFVRNISFACTSFFFALALLGTPRKQYDIIHLHENVLYPLIPLLAFRYKIVVTVHGITGFRFFTSPLLWPFFAFFLRQADLLIAVGKEDHIKLQTMFKRVMYIPNGVNIGLYRPTKVKPKITFVGRIHEQKGIVYLLQAFRTFSSHHPSLSLEIIGAENEYSRQLRKEFQDLPILWRGFLPPKTIAQALSSSYCIVLPSLWEGLPLTLFEALASRRPVLVSKLPSITAVVNTSEVQFITPRSVPSIISALNKIFADAKNARNMGARGRLKAKQYDWNIIADKTREAYASVLK